MHVIYTSTSRYVARKPSPDDVQITLYYTHQYPPPTEPIKPIRPSIPTALYHLFPRTSPGSFATAIIRLNHPVPSATACRLPSDADKHTANQQTHPIPPRPPTETHLPPSYFLPTNHKPNPRYRETVEEASELASQKDKTCTCR